jgi:hypothetical protein
LRRRWDGLEQPFIESLIVSEANFTFESIVAQSAERIGAGGTNFRLAGYLSVNGLVLQRGNSHGGAGWDGIASQVIAQRLSPNNGARTGDTRPVSKENIVIRYIVWP